MRITRTPRIGVVWALLCIANSAAAGTIFEAVRIDTQTQKRDLSIRLLVSGQDTRADVSAKGRQLFSLIESGTRITLIDHVANIYVVSDVANNAARALAPVSTRVLPGKSFALGAHCSAVEMHWTETVYQVQCSTESDEAADTDNAKIKRTKVGEFLRMAAATRDPNQLFERATNLLTLHSEETSFPYVVRHFESGRMLGEVRMIGATESDIPRKAFELPKGLRRMDVDAAIHLQARR